VESCLDQRGVELELVCVDDGSTDGGGEFLEESARRDARIRVLRTAHRGLVAALNAGLAACRGELVARLDADDLMLPGRLAKQVVYLQEHPDTVGVGCRVRVEPEGAMTDGARRYLDWSNSLVTPADLRRELFVESPLVHPTMTLRRRVLEEANGWRWFDGPEDYDLWLRLVFDHGLELAKVPEVLHVWNDRPERLTRSDRRYRPEAFLALKCRYLVEYAIEPRGGYVLWGCGPVGKALARGLERLGWRPEAIVEVHPGRIGEKIFGAPVIPVERAADFSRFVHLGAVGQAGARERMRVEIERLALAEGEGFFFTA
jgi:glycosyltransferase involved in cell wall biosynthesis